MYESFEIENFRGIRRLALAGIQRIALVTGANNVGKSAVLEAVLVHSFGPNVTAVLSLLGLKGVGQIHVDWTRASESSWASLFYDFRTTEPIEFAAKLTSLGSRISRIVQVTDPLRLREISTAELGQ